jgi:hypothetical protein
MNTRRTDVTATMQASSRLILVWAAGLAILGAPFEAGAQSLDINRPAPLRPGVNDMQIDNQTGTQYWYFIAGPGTVEIHAEVMGTASMAAGNNAPLTFTVSDFAETWHTSKTLIATGTDKDRRTVFTANLKKPIKVVIGISAPTGGLIRLGDEYHVSVTGAVAYGQPMGDPIVGTFSYNSGLSQFYGLTKFKADGSIITANGTTGTWKLFDGPTHAYTVTIGNDHISVVLQPARGLVDSNDPDSIVFKAMK